MGVEIRNICFKDFGKMLYSFEGVCLFCDKNICYVLWEYQVYNNLFGDPRINRCNVSRATWMSLYPVVTCTCSPLSSPGPSVGGDWGRGSPRFMGGWTSQETVMRDS